MQKHKNVLTFIGFDSEYEDSEIIVFGAPFDGTTSFRPGARFAPSIMRNESYGLETYSPYLDKDLEDTKICDVGDLELPLGNTEKTMMVIEEFSKDVLNSNKIPVMIGGEHLVSYPVIKSVYEKYENLHILHFDAHTDLRDELFGEKLSHATVIRRAWDLVGDNRIHQFGIRSGEREEFKWAEKHTNLTKFTYEGLDETVTSIGDSPVYVTIDLDILDPSVMSGTGTPEPGGISFNDMMVIIEKLQRLNIVGADVVELSPHYDQSGASTAVACKVLRELVLAISN
ncbi:agmatinase SpeB [Gottschalkia acidurici 9a]|uniref:Agmatinase SpeB n=1 Tax=Gottschalkia acidurici (strain ATCC 7906 / DSM 604 / BCRC 14475 / CIP 104303 / KCTC 5404 / NCIMB 10678 / 9a) TaxID=1128398 RepID=K0AWS3_GOTA9|nr:agmatinase [Gottschalkia acidurici]AFS77227.1 agmatinase SpeB [Gottschalkia acidurici 9a]